MIEVCGCNRLSLGDELLDMSPKTWLAGFLIVKWHSTLCGLRTWYRIRSDAHDKILVREVLFFQFGNDTV